MASSWMAASCRRRREMGGAEKGIARLNDALLKKKHLFFRNVFDVFKWLPGADRKYCA